MPFVVNPVWVFPPSVTLWRLRWLDWRLRRLDSRRTPKRARLEAIRHERSVLDKQCSLENPNKHDELTKLKDELNHIERELGPLDQSFHAISRTRVRHLTATPYK